MWNHESSIVTLLLLMKPEEAASSAVQNHQIEKTNFSLIGTGHSRSHSLELFVLLFLKSFWFGSAMMSINESRGIICSCTLSGHGRNDDWGFAVISIAYRNFCWKRKTISARIYGTFTSNWTAFGASSNQFGALECSEQTGLAIQDFQLLIFTR